MDTEIKTLKRTRKTDETEKTLNLTGLLNRHGELIAAIVSGFLILTGWLLSTFEQETTSILFFILAFLIGGFAKAKEGIADTIADRELNVEMLMIFAAIGSAIIGYWAEGAILIFIFALSGALETYTMNKSQNEISALMDLQPEEALRLKDGSEQIVPVSILEISDHIIVKPGERIPADGKITRGQSTLDEATITGESIPTVKSKDDEVFAGTVNMTGAIIVEVTKKNTETLFHKILELVQTAQSEKSPSQLFIEKFEGTYVKIVLIVVGLMMLLPHFLLGWSWTETFYRAMILLVVASPCALVASIMPATLSAISNGARKGILFKGGVHFERLGNLQAIAFDKTGTLTNGKPEVTDTYFTNEELRDDLLLKVAAIEKQSTHPLAQAIVKFIKNEKNIDIPYPELVEDVAGWGVVGTVNGDTLKIGKLDFVGKEDVQNALPSGLSERLGSEGKSIVYIKQNEDVVGLLALKDVVREETIRAIEELRGLGVKTIMLTGDGEQTAKAVAIESHIDAYFSNCLPQFKVDQLTKLKESYDVVAMVGDGINDAPALATANVGIAMGEGTDVALETADVVLMKNELTRIAEAVKLSKRMNKIIKQNIVFSITVIMLLICSNFFQILDLPYGVIGHEGSTILVILNGLRLLK